MKNKVLSPFPYYGGKAKMSPLICSMLDYQKTQLYIEPYGGGCRTLLNKIPHEVEMYNDFGYGLTTFFEVMTKEEKTEELIDMLLREPPTKESFDYLVLKRMSVEDRLNTDSNARLSSLALQSYKNTAIGTFRQLTKAISQENYESIIEVLETILNTTYILSKLEKLEIDMYQYYYDMYTSFWAMVKDTRKNAIQEATDEFNDVWQNYLNMTIPKKKNTKVYKLYEKSKSQYVNDMAVANVYSYSDDILITNELGQSIKDIEAAFMIFILYYSSRDGIGVSWSNEKNQNPNAYIRAVKNLRNIHQRMKDVMITQVDALMLIRQYKEYENVMIYLDPSYLKPEDESKNLGTIYKMSYDRQQHEKLLREITTPDVRAKILISNYDVDLYNDYLCDWDKTYYKTFTGVGSKKGNRRLEVLWKNY